MTFFPEDNVTRATALAGLSRPWRVRTAIALGRPRADPQRHGSATVPMGRRAVSEILELRDQPT